MISRSLEIVVMKYLEPYDVVLADRGFTVRPSSDAELFMSRT